jgi:hypothetical protein
MTAAPKVSQRGRREKGDKIERELLKMHADIGIKAERVPLSGASRYRGNGADLDVYALGQDEAPLVTEVKARANGEGFTTIERWLSDADALFLRRDQEAPGKPAPPPLVVLPWRTWRRLLKRLSA